MASRALFAGAALAGTSVTLWGCGGETTAAPFVCQKSDTVEKAWDNHFGAFGKLTEGLDQIMCDYDEESMISVFNDKCAGGDKREGYAEYKGKAAIRGFFAALFEQLDSMDNVNSVGPGMNNTPVVIPGDAPNGNVFLTWRTSNLEGAKEIQYATDSFSFRTVDGQSLIWKQNIVTTEPGKTCEEGGPKTVMPDPPTGLYAAWDNHFTAFAAFNDSMIMDDYTEDSLVQVWDARTEEFSDFKGLEKIQGMFQKLFADIKAAGQGGDYGITVPLQQVEPAYNGVFLVWTSNSHPKATDTFVFNDAHKIIRQNIVVQTKAGAEATAEVVQIPVHV